MMGKAKTYCLGSIISFSTVIYEVGENLCHTAIQPLMRHSAVQLKTENKAIMKLTVYSIYESHLVICSRASVGHCNGLGLMLLWYILLTSYRTTSCDALQRDPRAWISVGPPSFHIQGLCNFLHAFGNYKPTAHVQN